MKQGHPSEADLALLAGGDCNWLRRLSLNRHVAQCGDCRDTLASFGELRTVMRSYTRETGAPDVAQLDWNSLAGEMRANIRLGLAAGECIGAGSFADPPRRAWKLQLAVGTVCIALVAGAGVFLHGLLPHNAAASATAAAVLETTGAGVEVRSGSGSSMTLLNHGDVTGDQTVTSQGAVQTSSFDGDAGTVTVTSVYVE